MENERYWRVSVGTTSTKSSSAPAHKFHINCQAPTIWLQALPIPTKPYFQQSDVHNLAQTDKEYWDIPQHETLFGFSTNINEPPKLEGRWLALSSSAQADIHAVECLSTPCRFCPRLRTSDCSKYGLGGGLDRITCAHNFHVKIFFLGSPSEFLLLPTTVEYHSIPQCQSLFLFHLWSYDIFSAPQLTALSFFHEVTGGTSSDPISTSIGNWNDRNMGWASTAQIHILTLTVSSV